LPEPIVTKCYPVTRGLTLTHTVEIDIGDWMQDTLTIDDGPTYSTVSIGGGLGNLITNADQGVLYSWGSTPDFYLTTISTSNASASTVQVAMVLEQTSPVTPLLQRQDGNLVGTVSSTVGSFMIAFAPSGQTLFTVPYDMPKIATSDNGVIGASGTTNDQNGNVTGQIANLPTQSGQEIHTLVARSIR
jgi:hypothetical protein